MNLMNGLLLIDKPKGCTSHDVVGRARRILGLRAIGHAGTLDPLASGLLVLLLGEGTKVSDFILNGDKAYEVKARLGVRTDTLDMDGEIISQVTPEVSQERIAEVVAGLCGKLTLPIPIHSAVKVQGKKLYEYARRDQEVEVPMREMVFSNIRVLEMTPSYVRVEMRCSKGSFIRAWVSKLGEELGCGAAVEELRRTLSDPYTVDQAITLEVLEEKWRSREVRDAGVLGTAFVPLKESLPTFRTLFAQGKEEVLIKNGQIPNSLQGQLLSFISPTGEAPHVKVISRNTDDLLTILVAEPGKFYKIRRVFHAL